MCSLVSFPSWTAKTHLFCLGFSPLKKTFSFAILSHCVWRTNYSLIDSMPWYVTWGVSLEAHRSSEVSLSVAALSNKSSSCFGLELTVWFRLWIINSWKVLWAAKFKEDRASWWNLHVAFPSLDVYTKLFLCVASDRVHLVNALPRMLFSNVVTAKPDQFPLNAPACPFFLNLSSPPKRRHLINCYRRFWDGGQQAEQWKVVSILMFEYFRACALWNNFAE